jgi:hypothetical protein
MPSQIFDLDSYEIGGGASTPTTPTGWPELDDVVGRLEDMGMTPPSDDTIAQVILACIAAWERMTGYDPFLADAEDSTWLFQPRDSCVVDFDHDDGPGGFVSITSVTVAKTYASPTGNVQVAGRDYQLKPANAVNKGKPYTYLLSKAWEWDGGEASVQVIGRAGYTDTVPADAWEAVMRCILSLLLPVSQMTATGGASSIKQGPVEWKFDGAGSTSQAQSHFEQYEADVISGYAKMRIA